MVYALSAVLIIAIATTVSLLFTKQRKLAKVLITLSTLLALLGSVSLPAIAVANPVPSTLSSSTQSPDHQPFRFEEDIYVSADQCGGLCIAQEQTGVQSDSDLLQAIRSNITNGDSLDIAVDNGAVYLAGSVNDEAAARNLIKQVETIPGVHWITVALALKNQAQSIAG